MINSLPEESLLNISDVIHHLVLQSVASTDKSINTSPSIACYYSLVQLHQCARSNQGGAPLTPCHVLSVLSEIDSPGA